MMAGRYWFWAHSLMCLEKKSATDGSNGWERKPILVGSKKSAEHRNPQNSSASLSLSTESPNGDKERGMSSNCSPPNTVRSSSSGREQTAMKSEAPLDRMLSPGYCSKSVAGTPKAGIGERTMSDKTCDQNHVRLRMDARDISTDGETPLEDGQHTRDLNMDYSGWPFSRKEYVVPRTSYAGTSQVLPRNDDLHNETWITREESTW